MFGLLAAGIFFLVSSLPHGEAITLLPPPTPAPIRIQVSGAVAIPGVYSLPKGSRIEDAVQAAGGLLPEAYVQTLNFAKKMEDGEQIIIPSISENEVPNETSKRTQSSIYNQIDINTATLEVLDTLPGVGPVTAQNIIDYRTNKGQFTNTEELMNVPGIGQAMFDKIKELITISP
jgi:competence protein ComEA